MRLADIEIYTDGACAGNPGRGGWGFLLIRGADETECFGGEAHTTNNRMELTAACEALEQVQRTSIIRVFTDSTYVRNGATSNIGLWSRNGYRASNGAPLKNADLWRRLFVAMGEHDIMWSWVRGHSGNVGNERADKLARCGIPKVQR